MAKAGNSGRHLTALLFSLETQSQKFSLAELQNNRKSKFAFAVGKQGRVNPLAPSLHMPDEDKINWYSHKQ